MQFRVTCFEMKRLGEDSWHEVSEKIFLQNIAECVDPITPALAKMLQGGEIETQQGIYRIRC
jgi:hypothetical protein